MAFSDRTKKKLQLTFQNVHGSHLDWNIMGGQAVKGGGGWGTSLNTSALGCPTGQPMQLYILIVHKLTSGDCPLSTTPPPNHLFPHYSPPPIFCHFQYFWQESIFTEVIEYVGHTFELIIIFCRFPVCLYHRQGDRFHFLAL